MYTTQTTSFPKNPTNIFNKVLHLKYFTISYSLLQTILNFDNSVDTSPYTVLKLPKDSRILFHWFSPNPNSVAIILESAEFKPVQIGNEIPELNVKFQRIDGGLK